MPPTDFKSDVPGASPVGRFDSYALPPAPAMRVNRRRARLLVLALLLLSFLGPWGAVRHLGPRPSSRLYYLPEVLATALGAPWASVVVLAAAILALPITCFAAVVAPSSRLFAAVYRLMGGGIAALAAWASWRSPPAPEDMLETWGASLYLVALLVATVAEVLPARRAPRPDYAAVFK